jgi:hypothetical protein
MKEAQRFRFEDIHPDPLIAREVAIDCLLGVITEARAAIVRGLDYNAVTPNGVSIKNTLRNALARTSGEDIESRLYHESVAAVAPSRSPAEPPECGICGAKPGERGHGADALGNVHHVPEGAAAGPSEREAQFTEEFLKQVVELSEVLDKLRPGTGGAVAMFCQDAYEKGWQARAAVPQADRKCTCPTTVWCGDEMSESTCELTEEEHAAAAVPATGRELLDAAALLRMAARKLKRGDGSSACFADKIVDWLKRNGLQGSILRADSGASAPSKETK